MSNPPTSCETIGSGAAASPVKKTKASSSLIAGALAGAICTITCSPLDVAKVRMIFKRNFSILDIHNVIKTHRCDYRCKDLFIRRNILVAFGILERLYTKKKACVDFSEALDPHCVPFHYFGVFFKCDYILVYIYIIYHTLTLIYGYI